MSAASAPATAQGHRAVPLCGIAGRGPLTFPVFLCTASATLVLYRDASAKIDDDQVDRLFQEGVREFWVRDEDRAAYLHRVETSLSEVLSDRRATVARRADVLHGVATTIADEVLHGPVDRAGIVRAQRMLVAASGLVLREQGAFAAVRAMLGASESLARHSVSISFLSMGLARHALSADPATVVQAGLAGMFHDIGSIGHEDAGHDPDHAQRGFAMLKQLGMPAEIAVAAQSHHERWDGSGYPQALRTGAIPPLARVVGLCDAFDEVYSAQQERVRVFDALAVLAEAWRGCFDANLAASFVKLFR